MRKRFWVALAAVLLGIFLAWLMFQAGNQPTLEDYMAECQIPQEEIHFTAADFMAAVTVCREYPMESVSQEDYPDMEIYSQGEEVNGKPLDTLTVAYLENGVQYEYFSSREEILYRAVLAPEATLEAVTVQDFEQAEITAIDMAKLRTLGENAG